jgi:hypothetical protein
MTEPITQNDPQSVRELHELYCQCTGQNLSLRFDRERLWYEFLRAGFNAADLSRARSIRCCNARCQPAPVGHDRPQD